ncbi:MAG: hypothetical protein QM778_21775 [Myxococcales bacterium]
MATHRVSFPHIAHTPSADQRGAHRAVSESHPEPNFGLFMLAPVIIALTTLAISWISKVSFGG